jgi:hypothetical protein
VRALPTFVGAPLRPDLTAPKRGPAALSSSANHLQNTARPREQRQPPDAA